MSETFGELLRSYRERGGWSRNSLAHLVGINASYWTRCENGDRDPPRSHLVEAMARTMLLKVEERDRLLVAAGYKPTALNGSGWHPALHDVAAVLNDYLIPEEDREEFGRTVQAIAQHWRPGASGAGR